MIVWDLGSNQVAPFKEIPLKCKTILPNLNLWCIKKREVVYKDYSHDVI